MDNIEELKNKFVSLKEKGEEITKRYEKEKWQKEKLKEDIKKFSIKIEENEIEKEELTKEKILFTQTAEFAREQSKKQVEAVVTRFLKYVYGDSFSFKIEITNKGKQPWADFYVVSNEGEREIKTSAIGSRGGGIVDVVSLALRVTLLQSHNKPVIDGPLILDEPSKHVSQEYISKVTQFFKEINQCFGRQIICVTHKDHLVEMADKGFKVDICDSNSSVYELTN